MPRRTTYKYKLKKNNSKKKKLNLKKRNKYLPNNKNLNPQKHTIVVVYGKIHMNGCGHCENLIPEWEIVNTKMQGIVCFDIERTEEENKLPHFNNTYKPVVPLTIQGGYPTIYKLHKHGGNIIYYNGQRDNQSILHWLNENENETMK